MSYVARVGIDNSLIILAPIPLPGAPKVLIGVDSKLHSEFLPTRLVEVGSSCGDSRAGTADCRLGKVHLADGVGGAQGAGRGWGAW